MTHKLKMEKIGNTVVHGLWTIEYGPWTIDDEAWSMERGVWSLKHGAWSMRILSTSVSAPHLN